MGRPKKTATSPTGPTETPADDPFLTIPEVARQLGISRPNVYDYLNRGALPRESIGTGTRPRLRVRQSAVTAFKDQARMPLPSRDLPGRAA